VSGELGRLGTVAWLSFRSGLQGIRAVGLAAFALLPTAIVAAIASARPAAGTLSDSALSLFTLLTLPIVAMVILLVLAVAQFRTEIDSETLVFLSDRSIGRPTLVVGKYLGAVGASLAFVLPAALLPLAVAVLGGGTAYDAGVPSAVAAAAVLATVAYAGFFLFLGLATRSALLVGLLFGFLWEELLPLLPGEVPQFTVIFYLRSFLSGMITSGPLSGYHGSVATGASVTVLVLVSVAFVVFASVVFRYLETAPEKESA
jgi:ABC-2 type transport system permease protein